MNAVQLINLWKLPPAHNGCGIASAGCYDCVRHKLQPSFKLPLRGILAFTSMSTDSEAPTPSPPAQVGAAAQVQEWKGVSVGSLFGSF